MSEEEKVGNRFIKVLEKEDCENYEKVEKTWTVFTIELAVEIKTAKELGTTKTIALIHNYVATKLSDVEKSGYKIVSVQSNHRTRDRAGNYHNGYLIFARNKNDSDEKS